MLVARKAIFEEQKKKLHEAFLKTRQIPEYDAFNGPNSNTWASMLLWNAGYGYVGGVDAPGWNNNSYGGGVDFRRGRSTNYYHYNKYGQRHEGHFGTCKKEDH